MQGGKHVQEDKRNMHWTELKGGYYLPFTG